VEERTIIQPSAFGSVRAGTRLNGIYEVEKLIAQGGMGEVYRGFNIQTRDLVAIKMIRPEFSDNQEVLELFRREASILHNLTHEAIVRYFVFSVDPDIRRAYLAMEFVDGPSLTKRLASGPLPLAEVNILQRRIASALEAAHRLGIVHRDVSPDNIILPNGDVRRAKIIDFGIARSLSVGERTIIGGGFAGKYNYVSPEQLGLMGGEVTFRSDIYSFGLVLAEAARGRALDMSGSQAEIIEKRRAVPDLSDVDRTIRPLIQAMLQPSPERRPISMAAVSAWGERPDAGGSAGRSRNADGPAKSQSSSGSLPAILGAFIALVSLGGAAYVFRDDLALWMGPTAPTPEAKAPPIAPTPPPTSTSQPPSQTANEKWKPPPLEPLATSTPSQMQTNVTGEQPAETQTVAPPLEGQEGQQATQTGSAQATHPADGTNPEGKQVVTADQLADAAPPRAPQPRVDLLPATVGTPYRAELPGFTEHGGKGLRLAADSLPEGLSFTDLGEGRGAIEGAPTRPGSAEMRVVATDHNGRTAEMTAALVIADRPTPPPPVPVKPAPPEQPEVQHETQPTPHAEPLPRPPPPQEARLEAPPTPAERERQFVEGYNGGDCFLVKPAGGARAYLGVGHELEPFQRFEEAFRRELGAEPQLSLRLITAPECPALDLIQSGVGGASGVPRIELADYRVGRGKPLSGKILNLGGRQAYLVLVDNDGAAYRLDVKPQPGSDSATFSVPLHPDASSTGPLQVVLAIVSSKPIPAVESFRSGPLKALAPALLEEARNGSASVGAEFFTFVK
jgi:serine/threonine-protein kinase